MKDFIINRDSWHYKLNTWGVVYETYWEEKHSNFCSYWRSTMTKLVFWLVASIWGFMMLSLVARGFYYEPIFSIVVFGILITIVLVIISVLFFNEYFSKKFDRKNSLIIQKYTAYKSKICPVVVYKK